MDVVRGDKIEKGKIKHFGVGIRAGKDIREDPFLLSVLLCVEITEGSVKLKACVWNRQQGLWESQ